MAIVFPSEAIEHLGSCGHDPGAAASYELISGSIGWDDERYMEFVALCRHLGCNHYGVLFAHRTSWLMARPREELRYAWEEVRERCPDWIGFRPERVTPSAAIQDFIRDSEDNS